MMSSNSQIVFYDIASNEPLRTFAPNPWKTRFALNYKGVPYTTQWIHMPDISSTREKLGVPANRILPDGTPYHTLPVIHDKAKDVLLGDTFEIAVFLDNTYPEGPRLFRPCTTGLTAAFNAQVDGLFTKHVGLATIMPLASLEASKAMFVKRAGANSWEDLQMSSEQREQTWISFEAALAELAKAYRHVGGTTDYIWGRGGEQSNGQKPPPGREEAGVFLDGDQPAYADFIVGAWLKMMEASMTTEDWQRVRGWQNGLWGRVADAMDKWAEIK